MKLQKPGIRSSLHAWRPGAASEEPATEKTESPVGVLLRASRLRCGGDLTGIAQTLRIRRNYLEALEEGHFGDLPGATYAVGFVRTYAEHLGLDGDEIVRRFKAEASGINQSTSLVFPSPTTEGSIPGGALLLVGALLAVMVYGGWYLLSTQNQTMVELVPKLPDRLMALVENVRISLTGEPSGAEVLVNEPPSPRPAPVVTPQVSAAPAPPTTAEVEAPPMPRPAATEAATGQGAGNETRTAAVPSAPAGPPAVPGTNAEPADRPAGASAESSEPPAATGTPEEGPARIVVRAKLDSWIQVRDDAGNQVLFTRQMKAGDTYDVPNRSGLKLLTGNAGALEILVDGEATPSLGPVGTVRRDIALNAELLRAGTAARP